MKLIALVAVVTGAGDNRKSIPPGEEVTGLNEVDIADLKACGAIEDADELAEHAKKDARAEKAAAKEFAEARKAVQASQAAIEAPAA